MNRSVTQCGVVSKTSNNLIRSMSQLKIRSREHSANTCSLSPISTRSKDLFADDIVEDYGFFENEGDCDRKNPQCQSNGLVEIHNMSREARKFHQQSKIPHTIHYREFLASTRCFGDHCWAWALDAFRITKNGSDRFAQYQVLIFLDNVTWVRWMRASHFEKLYFRAKARNWLKSVCRWQELLEEKPFFRCLDIPYLWRKSLLLERFLRQILFESDLLTLLRFTNAPEL